MRATVTLSAILFALLLDSATAAKPAEIERSTTPAASSRVHDAARLLSPDDLLQIEAFAARAPLDIFVITQAKGPADLAPLADSFLRAHSQRGLVVVVQLEPRKWRITHRPADLLWPGVAQKIGETSLVPQLRANRPGKGILDTLEQLLAAQSGAAAPTAPTTSFAAHASEPVEPTILTTIQEFMRRLSTGVGTLAILFIGVIISLINKLTRMTRGTSHSDSTGYTADTFSGSGSDFGSSDSGSSSSSSSSSDSGGGGGDW